MNNPVIFNAVIEGATGGVYERWITDNQSSDYLNISGIINVLATTIDALIPINPTLSLADGALMQSLVQGVFSERFVYSGISFDVIAQSIVLLYDTLRAQLSTAPFIPNTNIIGGAVGTVKGVAQNGVAGVLQDLTGDQQAATFRRGTQQTIDGLSGVVDIDLSTLFPNTPVTLLRIRSAGTNIILRSMQSGVNNPQNQEIVIVHERASGSAFLVIGHNMSTPTYARFFNSTLKPIILGETSAYLARGISGSWRSNDFLTAGVPLVVPVPALAAATLGYVNVSLIGTALEGTPANAVVTAQPQADLAAAGLNAGSFLYCRMSATNTLRFAFIGTLSAGNVTFTIGSK